MIQDIAGMLAGQDFGAWSRADIERIAGAAGWSVRDGEYRLSIETGGPAQGRSTKLGYGQDRFGTASRPTWRSPRRARPTAWTRCTRPRSPR